MCRLPVGVKHWHGAAPDSWFSHLAVEVPGTDTSNEWLEAVDDTSYGSLKQGRRWALILFCLPPTMH